MTDTVIKGTGNSRSIKTVPNIKSMVSSLDDLLDLFIAGFPVDILGLNPTGVQVQGTDLNKASLLTNATAALYGKGNNATPNEIFSLLPSLYEKHITLGTYTGSGNTSIPANFDTPTYTDWANITVGFKPKFVIVLPESVWFSEEEIKGGFFGQNLPLMKHVKDSYLLSAEITNNGFRVRNGRYVYMINSSMSSDTYLFLNSDKTIYRWAAIG